MSFDDEDLLIRTALIAIAILASGLALRLHLKRPAEQRFDVEREWPGVGFDTNSIADRIAAVRSDYAMALRARPHPRFHPASLLASASRKLRCSSYFEKSSRQQEPGLDHDEAQQKAA